MPFVGNLFQLPRTDIPRTYAAWSQQHGKSSNQYISHTCLSAHTRSITGPLYYLRVINRHFVVINSLELAQALFDKRGAIYSHRPRLVSVDLCRCRVRR